MKDSFHARTEFAEMFKEIFTFFDHYFWDISWVEHPKIAVAVSWWSDSMFLSHLILSYREERWLSTDYLYFLHCNHKVRKESDEEEKFLNQFFKGYHFISSQRENWKENITEENLINRRYEQFNSFFSKEGINFLLLWHNLTDRIETTFMNMIRWCWLNGFLNMYYDTNHPLIKNASVLRPLLYFSKDEIEDYCKQYEIPYFEDRTNFDTSVSIRNKLRHEFIFPLEKLGGKKNKFFDSWKRIYQDIWENQHNELCLKPMNNNPYWNSAFAYEWCIYPKMISETWIASVFCKLGIDLKQWEIADIKNRLINWKDWHRVVWAWTLFIAHKRCYLIATTKAFWEKELHLEKKIDKKGIMVFGNYQVDIPKELIWAVLRFPKTGDHYKGKLLTKRAINEKIPIFWRNILPLAEKDEKIIFVFEPQHLIY